MLRVISGAICDSGKLLVISFADSDRSGRTSLILFVWKRKSSLN